MFKSFKIFFKQSDCFLFETFRSTLKLFFFEERNFLIATIFIYSFNDGYLYRLLSNKKKL
jgi:hypothetical protein